MLSEKLLMSILLLAPLVGFLFNGFRFKSDNYKLAGAVATGAAVASFLCSLIMVVQLTGLPEESRKIAVDYFSWMAVGGFSVNFSFMLDPISAIMILVITGVVSLIHLFSVGYMSHDERPSKYFAYLNLLTH